MTIKFSAIIFMILSHLISYSQNTANIGLVYPLSSNWKHAPMDTNNFSLNLIFGVSAGERGITIAGVSNIIRKDAHGLQVAGFSNHVGNNATGALFAGFINTYKGGGGFAAAGFSNIARNSSGVQVAGFLNKGGNVSSLQIAGFANTAKNVNGSQVAGFINVAKKVSGVQLSGFINIADSADYQIGLINLAKNGEKSIGVTFDENQTTMFSFRSGGKLVYGIIGVGYNFKNKDEIYAYEAGLGAHLLRSEIFRLNAELTGSSLESFKNGESFKSSFSLMPAFNIGHSIEIFGGPSFNFVSTDTAEGKNLVKKYVRTWGDNISGRDFNGLYFGYTAGVQVAF